MNDNFFSTTLFALISAVAVVAATVELQAPERPAKHETTLAAQEVVTLPPVAVTGHRSSDAAPLATAPTQRGEVAVAVVAKNDH